MTLRTPLNKRGNTQPPIIFSALDPGKTEPGQMWIDISNGPGAWILKVRNNGSANWEILGSADGSTPVIADSDPGALGAGRLWIDSAAGSGSWELNIRNSDDSDWESLAAGGVTDLSPLEDRATSLESRADDLEDDLGSLTSTVSGHTSSLGTLNTTVSGHTSSLSTLSTNLTSVTSRVGTLEGTAPTTVSAVDPGAIGAGRLWVDITGGSTAWVLKARNVLNNGWEVLASGAVDISSVTGRLDTAETDIENIEIDITNLTASVDTNTQSLGDLDSTVTGHASQLSTLNSTVSSHTSSISSLTSADTALDGRLDTAESDISTIEGSLTTLQGTVTSQGSSLTSVSGRVTTLEGKPYVAVSSSNPGTIGSGNIWIDTSGGSGQWLLKVRNAGNNGWEDIQADIRSDFTTLETTVSGHTSSLSTLSAADTALDSRLDTLETDVPALDTRLDSLEPTVSGHTSSLSTINSTLTSLDSRIDTLEAASGSGSSPYTATITNSSGATITAATHGKGTKPAVVIYSGTTAIDTYITINGSGDVTWATSEAITGSIVIS